MKTLNEICKKDGKYVQIISEVSIVRNAVEMLGGRRLMGKRGDGNGSRGVDGEERDEEEGDGTREGGDEERRREGEEEGGDRKETKEERGGVIFGELRVGEKIGLLELLSGLVKRGVEMEDEEELKEVGMLLEEEGNKHVEEEIEGEGGEGGEEEEEEEEKKEEKKREWEELSERARNLVWVLEKMKNRREGKKSGTWKMMKQKEEEMKKKVEEEKRLKEEANKKVEEEKKKREEEKKRADEAEGNIAKMREELEEMKKEGVLHTQTPSNTPPITPNASSVITSLDAPYVIIIPDDKGIKREGNLIIHDGFHEVGLCCFIGGYMRSV